MGAGADVYQRRADLIPNLVETVKGFAAQEKSVLEAVTQARASAGSIKAPPELLNDPAAFKKFQDAQNQLGGALSRLLITVERYPELKSNQNFLALQSQLEGTENRITVERQRFNEAVRDYNTKIKLMPWAVVARVAGFKEKAFFESAPGARSSRGEVLEGGRRVQGRPHAPEPTAAPLLLFAALGGAASASLPIPPPPDHASMTTRCAVRRRAHPPRGQLRARERESSNQVVVAIFRSLQGESLEDYRFASPRPGGWARRGSTTVSSSWSSSRTGRCVSRSATVSSPSSPTRSRARSCARSSRRVSARQDRRRHRAGLDAVDQVIAGTYRRRRRGSARAQGRSPLGSFSS